MTGMKSAQKGLYLSVSLQSEEGTLAAIKREQWHRCSDCILEA